MPQSCTICNHAKRLSIDRKIVEGANLKEITRTFDVPYHSLYLHAQNHVSRQLVKAVETKLMIEGNDLLEIITKIMQRAEDISDRNYKKGNDVTALKAIDSQRNTIQLLNNISMQILASKKLEFEMSKEARGESEAQIKQEYRDKLIILSSEELAVYGRLINKIINQNNDKVISNNKVLVPNNSLT